jgi:tRNA dimethylallyltransferase
MGGKHRILILVGPTSSGKSALAVELARRFGGEVISADSRQVYRGLDIGTGKIPKREMRSIPHHLLDVASPKKYFSADDFVKRAGAAIEGIASRGKLPIIAGGTGFYADALAGRIALPNVPPNAALRTRLEKKSAAQLFAMLKKKDMRRAKTIEPHHKRRLIRALEIAAALGRVPQNNDLRSRYEPLWVGIAPKMEKLEKNIYARLLARMKRGMAAEAKRLHADGLSYKRMGALGLEYRSLARFLQKKITREQMIGELRRAIRRYAKKQMAYWRRNREIEWFASPTVKDISRAVEKWIKK